MRERRRKGGFPRSAPNQRGVLYADSSLLTLVAFAAAAFPPLALEAGPLPLFPALSWSLNLPLSLPASRIDKAAGKGRGDANGGIGRS